MGFFDFNGSKPKVTPEEYHHKVKSYLLQKGFNTHELEKLDGYFQGSVREGGVQKGVDAHEIEQTVSWLREHPHDHHFDDHKIDTIEHAFKKHL